ncbi:ketosamine-3-kinase-like isoform X2 [Ascaphus truei]
MFNLLSRRDPAGLPDTEEQLKKLLKTSMLRPAGHYQRGGVSKGQSYDTDRGLVFVKINLRAQARTMFDGEIAGLEAIRETNTVRVPQPIAVTDLPTGGALLVMEHLEMKNVSRFAEKLGEQLADLHLHNVTLKRKVQKLGGTIGQFPAHHQLVEKFGFHTVTCCGYIPQVNEWHPDWATFFTSQRLQPQLDLIQQEYGDRTVCELWSGLQIKVPRAFTGADIFPALLHGDLWEENIAEDESGPVLYDPGCFYGHSEYELAIGDMFGVHCGTFYSAYHRKIPRAPGFEMRLQLYQLFHSLNNWNHFGLGYRAITLSLMRSLINGL